MVPPVRRLVRRKSGNDFGRAVSRFLSASLRTERIICLSSPYPEPVRFRVLRRAVARFPIWPCTRWGLPCRVACASRGALLPHLFTLAAVLPRRRFIFCGTVRRRAFRLLRPRVSPAEPELRGIAPCGVRTFLQPLARPAILHLPKIATKVANTQEGFNQRQWKIHRWRIKFTTVCCRAPRLFEQTRRFSVNHP